MVSRPRVLIALLALLVLASSLACEERSVTAVDVATVTVSPNPATLLVGATRQFDVEVRDAGGNVLPGRSVTWSVSDPALARSEGDGLITGLAPGPATVSATADGVTGSADVTVMPGEAIALAPEQVTWTLAQGAAQPAVADVAVTNPNGGTLTGLRATVDHTAGQPGGWLTATLSGATAPATLTLSGAAGTLAPGSYQATVTVAAAGSTSPSRTLPVQLVVSAAAPAIQLEASSVAFSAAAGGSNPPSQAVQVSNSGGGTLTGLGASIQYASGQPGDWLTASLSPATAPSTLTLSANVAGLPTGTYNATVLVSAAIAGNSPQSLPVTLTVGAQAPAIALSETARAFSAVIGAGDPGGHVINVTNAGGGTLGNLSATVAYPAGQATDWLTATLGGSTAPATLTLQPRTGALAAGTYSATVEVRSDVAANSPQTVAVTFQVSAPSAPPAIVLSPDTATFGATVGGASPASRAVQVTNGGAGTLAGLTATVSYGSGATGWLTATLSTTTAPATLTLQAATGSLAPGTYTATVQVASSDATITPRTVSVTFVVGSAPVPPAIGLANTTASFTATPGGGDPASQAIAVSNAGGGTLDNLSTSVQYGTGQPTGWLSATLTSTTAPATLTLQPRTGSLAAGTYTATVAVQSPVASNSPQSLTVTFQVNAAATPPAIGLSPTTVGFTAVAAGGNPASQTVSVSNIGGGTLSGLSTQITYTSGQPGGWLTRSLSTTTAPATLTLQAATGLLPPGTYTARVNVSSSAASNSPQEVVVTFQVTAPIIPPAINLSPTSLSFSGTAGASNPSSQTVNVSNSGGSTLDALTATVRYGSGQPSGWLAATLGSTTAPTQLTVQPTIGQLAAGTYNATIEVASSRANNSPQTVPVTFTVNAAPVPPAIGLSASSASFTATAGGGNPSGQNIDVTNTGGGSLDDVTLAVSYGSGQPSGWLAASLASNTAPTQLNLAPATGSLAAGTYNATVEVRSNKASNSPRTVAVTFTVNPPAPSLPAAPTNLRAQEKGNDRIELDWDDNADNETEYLVQRSLLTVLFQTVATLKPDTEQYDDTGLARNTRYYYRVLACNAAGCSASNIADDRTKN